MKKKKVKKYKNVSNGHKEIVRSGKVAVSWLSIHDTCSIQGLSV